MCYKNSRKLGHEVKEAEEKEVINSETRSSLQKYYQNFINVALNNTLTVIVAFIGLFFLTAGIFEVLRAYNFYSFSAPIKTILYAIPLLISGVLFYLSMRDTESRESNVIKEFVSTVLYASFLWFVTHLLTEYEVFNSMDLAFFRWIAFFVALVGVVLCFFRNSTGVMLLTIPVILLFTFFPQEASGLSLGNLFSLGGLWGLFSLRGFFSLFTANPASLYLISIMLFSSLFLHFWLNVDTLSKKQPLKPVIIGWVASILGYYYFKSIIPGNDLLFSAVYIIGLYVFGKIYFNANSSWYGRPLQTFALILTISNLYYLSNSDTFTMLLSKSGFYGVSAFGNADYDFWLFLIALLVVGAGLFYFYVKPMFIDGEEQFNPIIISFPFFILFLMLIALLEWVLFPVILVNFFLIGLCVYLMVNGSQEKYHVMYLLGLFVLFSLMYQHYQGMEMHWILRSLFFLIVGATFFGIAFTLKDRTEGHEEP